ncbi:MAG: transcriptional regulator, AraC family [Herbinix sp.]|jgi:AraC-like DNA-binding protein|nr:transcriptional regulator, AraC family [Herbinix sp.]
MSNAETYKVVQDLQVYMENNLYKSISLKELAEAAGYSPWHMSRIFKDVTGKTPFDYLRALRLTKAALLLRDNNRKILDVALDFVFDSHEGFTRAFSKEFGVSPHKYNKTTPPIQLFLPEKVFNTYKALHKEEIKMCNESKLKSVFVQVIERPTRKVLLKRGCNAEEYFAYCEEVGCDVWPLLTSVKEALYEPIGMWLPKHMIMPGTSLYVQGVEVPTNYSNIIPAGYELIELPPCTMMVFQGEPYDDENFSEAVTETWEYINRFNPQIYGYEWDAEAAPRFQLAPMGYRGYIEARPVKKANQ